MSGKRRMQTLEDPYLNRDIDYENNAPLSVIIGKFGLVNFVDYSVCSCFKYCSDLRCKFTCGICEALDFSSSATPNCVYYQYEHPR